MKDKAVFIACPEANMTYVSFTSNPAFMLRRVSSYNVYNVELVADIAASRSAVAYAQKTLNGSRAHHNWFDGLVTLEQAEALVADGEREFARPDSEEWISWRFQCRLAVEDVENVNIDDDDARLAWSKANAMLEEMEPRVVVDEHIAQVRELRERLTTAASSRAA